MENGKWGSNVALLSTPSSVDVNFIFGGKARQPARNRKFGNGWHILNFGKKVSSFEIQVGWVWTGEKRRSRQIVNGWFQRFLATPQISQNYGLCQPVFTILNDCHNKTKFTTGFRRMAKSVSSISFVTLSHLHLPITVPVYSLFLFTFAPTVPLNPPLLCTHCSSVPSVLCSSVPSVPLYPLSLCSCEATSCWCFFGARYVRDYPEC